MSDNYHNRPQNRSSRMNPHSVGPRPSGGDMERSRVYIPNSRPEGSSYNSGAERTDRSVAVRERQGYPAGSEYPQRTPSYPDRPYNNTYAEEAPDFGRSPSGYDFHGQNNNAGQKRKTSAGRIIITTLAGILLVALCAAAAIFWLRPTDGGDYFSANGALPPAGNPHQINAFDSIALLKWDSVDSVAGYNIYRHTGDGDRFTYVKTAYLNFTLLTGLDKSSSCEYIIRPYCNAPNGEYYEEENADIFFVKTIPDDAGLLSHKSSAADSIVLGWQPIDGADGYEVECGTGERVDWSPYGDSTANEISVNDLAASTEYCFRMRPYIDIGSKRCYGGWSDSIRSATSPEAVSGLAQGETTDSGYALIWNEGSASTGYELYRADPETGEITELIGQCGTTRYEISGLDSVSFSSYSVRAFLRHSSGISYSEYSDIFTAATLPSVVGGLDQYTTSKGKYTISWEPSDRAEGYEVYAYSCNRGEYDLLATVTDSCSYTVSGLSEYAEHYIVRAYFSFGDMKFLSESSEKLTCYPYYYLKRTVKVSTGGTALRAGAGPEFEQIDELKKNTTGRVLAELSGSDGVRWFRVELKNGTIGWISNENVKITNNCGTLATREYTDEEPIIIYLSPSRQGDNPYCIGNTTEKEQMEAVAAVTHRILKEEYNCIVYTATPELTLRQRAFEALELKADVYLAIHSNATGNSEVHYGASSYYCGASGRSRNLGKSINAKLGEIAPEKCTLDKQLYSALESFSNVGYAEVRDPYNLGMVSLLAETDFHDNELTAQWIIDNHEAIGRAYAEALAETFDIEKRS